MALNAFRLLSRSSRACRNPTQLFQRCELKHGSPTKWNGALYMSTGAEPKQAGPAQTELLLSDSCVKQLHSLGQKDKFLRVVIEGGGCSGFQYKFELDTEMTDDDRVFERDGAKVVVDNVSLDYIKGSTVDYHQELIRSAFRVIDNPSAEMGCSCGASFSLKF